MKIYTLEEIDKVMENLRFTFDVVRLVNPSSFIVINDGHIKTDDEPCYAIWKKNERCINCISMQACISNQRKIKIEFDGDEIYNVTVMPVRVIKEDGRPQMVAVEMANRITDDLILRGLGKNEIVTKITQYNDKIYKDSLTGVYNRRFYDEKLFLYVGLGYICKSIGIIVGDARLFKYVNDKYGHVVGDKVLRLIATTLKENVRDPVIRMGGDEFLIAMRNCDEEVVTRRIEDLRKAINEIKIDNYPEIRLNMNFGYSYCSEFNLDEDIEVIMNKADENMYLDKQMTDRAETF